MPATVFPSPIIDARKQRCTVCKARPAECLCGALQRVPAPLPLRLLQHARERFSQSNTGNLVWRVLVGTTIVRVGDSERPLQPDATFDASLDPLVLFPLPDVPVIGPEDALPAAGRAPALIVLDGTWRQARRMSRRIPGLRRLRFRRLPDIAEPRWRLREPTRPGQVSTAEAVAWALERLGFRQAAEAMWDAIDLVARRVLLIRGRRAPRAAERSP